MVLQGPAWVTPLMLNTILRWCLVICLHYVWKCFSKCIWAEKASILMFSGAFEWFLIYWYAFGHCLSLPIFCDASLYQFPFYIVQDVFNLLPNLNVADLIKAFAGKWIKGANFCVSFIIFHSLIYHISIMCSENKWYDVGYLSFVSHPKCSRSPQLDQQQGEITFFFSFLNLHTSCSF